MIVLVGLAYIAHILQRDECILYTKHKQLAIVARFMFFFITAKFLPSWYSYFFFSLSLSLSLSLSFCLFRVPILTRTERFLLLRFPPSIRILSCQAIFVTAFTTRRVGWILAVVTYTVWFGIFSITFTNDKKRRLSMKFCYLLSNTCPEISRHRQADGKTPSRCLYVCVYRSIFPI